MHQMASSTARRQMAAQPHSNVQQLVKQFEGDYNTATTQHVAESASSPGEQISLAEDPDQQVSDGDSGSVPEEFARVHLNVFSVDESDEESDEEDEKTYVNSGCYSMTYGRIAPNCPSTDELRRAALILRNALDNQISQTTPSGNFGQTSTPTTQTKMEKIAMRTTFRRKGQLRRQTRASVILCTRQAISASRRASHLARRR